MNSTRKIAVITGVIFIIATVLPCLVARTCPHWAAHSVICTYEPGAQECCSFSSGTSHVLA